MRSIVILLLVLLSSSSAYAGGFITPNSQVPGDSVQLINDGSTVTAYLESGLSYCCAFHANTYGVSVKTVSTTVSINSSVNVTAIDRTGTTPIHAGIGLNGTTGNRLCLTPTLTGGAAFTIVDISSNSQAVTTQCEETTLYGSFNTNANPFNFLEITNISNSDISGKIFATTFAGTNVINGTEFTVPANRRVDVSIHDSAGANVFGAIKITHDGPLGSIKANTSYYSGPVSALELKATVPATIRDRH